MKKMPAIVALVAVFTLAICLIILGSISTELMEALGINSGQFGTLVTALFLTSCIVQLITGPIVDKIGHKPVAVIGFASVSISMFILAFASGFSTALIACIILGIGAMSVNTVGNTLIPVVLFGGKDPARASKDTWIELPYRTYYNSRFMCLIHGTCANYKFSGSDYRV